MEELWWESKGGIMSVVLATREIVSASDGLELTYDVPNLSSGQLQCRVQCL